MKELENKISSVFLPEKQVVVNARETDTADSVRYKYDIAFGGQSPRRYIAMQKMPEDDDFVEKEIVAPAFARVRKRENENKLNLGSSSRNGLIRDRGLSDVREEKEGNTDYVAPVFKGAIGGTAERAWTAFSSVYHSGMDLGSWIAELKTGDEKNTNIDEEIRRSIAQSMMAKEEVMKFLNLVPDENDSQAGYELGNVFGSVLESFAIAGLTKSTSAMAAYIGLSSGGGAYEELRTGGVQPLESVAVAFGVGFTGGMLERYGLHNLIEAWSTKRLRSAVFKSMAGEFLQEASQTGAEELLMAPYREGYQPEILKEMATAGVYGSIGGLFGFGLGRAMNTRARSYYKSLLQKDYNVSPEKADELVEAAFLDNDQAKTELKELLDNETIATLENDNAVEDAKQVMQEGKDLFDRMLAQRVAGLSDEMQARVDEVEESLRQNAINNGLDEQEAAATANLGASIVRKVAELAREQGLDVNEEVERAAFSLQDRQNQEKMVDENFQEVRSDMVLPEERQNELDEERIAMMVEDGGMSVEEATFRVKTGREPTELDEALGYDFVPYQTGEALTERENGYKIADDSETVETVVIPDNALPEFKTRADLRNWLIGKFNEIGSVTIKSTGANVEFNKTGAQRAIKNARQKKNNIAYPEIEKVVSGAKYSGFREADERHQNVKGQDVYHSGVVYKGVPYSVEFYVDVPLSGNTGDNFAGNKIREIKIAPTETRVTSENQNRPANNLSDAISNISLAVLRGKVKPARYDMATKTLYQLPQAAYGADSKADINTPEFKRWFGDSLVVDENGRPLVVYHGTDAEFDVFDRGKASSAYGSKYGFYFANKEVAEGYGDVMPVYLAMKKPYEVDVENEINELLFDYDGDTAEAEADGYRISHWRGETREDFEATDSATSYLDDNYDDIFARAEENGADGVIVRGADGSVDYVVFEPNQIKSVDNRGSFSRTDDNIYYQMSYFDDLGFSKSVRDIKTFLSGLKPKEEVRLMFDKKKRYWFAIDANDYIHNDMITKAYKQGLYPEFNSEYDARQYFDENYMADDEYLIRFKATKYGSEKELQSILQEQLNYDEYTTAYSINTDGNSGYIIFARGDYDLKDTPLKGLENIADRWGRNPNKMNEVIKTNDNTYYQFAGENALTADTNSLSQARTMELNDYSDEEIYQETGWFKGADGKWRFEISDDEAVVDLSNVVNDTTVALDSILQHDKLFAAYPELRNLSVMVDSSMKDGAAGASFQQGVWDEEYGWLGQRISINPDILYRKDIDLKSILMHEIQHALQRKEGFATGGAPSMFFDKENMQIFQRFFQEQADKKFNQAVLDALYGKLSVDAANKISDADGKYLAASEKYINAIGETEETQAEEVYNDAEQELNNALAEAGKNADWLAELKAKARETAGLDKLGKSKRAKNYNPWDLYKQLYGEIEARNTQTRMDMSEEERRATPPEETQDIKNADAIVVWEDGTVMAYVPDNKNYQWPAGESRLLYPVMGQYEPLTKVITLFKGRDKTTFTHEMLHHYLPIYLNLLERGGKWDSLRGLYDELGVSRMADMGREGWEKLVDMGTSYIFYNQAPNEASKSIFEYAKQWMIDAYNTVKRFIKPSKEIEQFFDELLSGEEMPDITNLRGRAAELAKILQGAKNGQELTVNGLSLRDISKLRQALYARVPAAGKTLADEIRAAGGIDTESELARQLGYDSRRGTETGFWNYKGAIKDESQLLEFLREHGYLPDTTENTYEETSAVWDKVQSLIDERDSTYNEQERARQMKRESALAAGEVVSQILDEHYIGDVKKLEEDLRAATKMLADKGAAAVDKTTLDYLTFAVRQMEGNYRRLLYADKEKRYNYQEQLTKFIKDLPLDYNHKSKFMDKIRMVKDERTFNKYLNEIKERTEKYVAQEQRRMLSDLIQSEVKSSRPRKVMAQKYDYENNVLFKDLRDYNKLTQASAAAQLYALDEQEKARQESGENPGSRGYLLRRMFLEYKANGMDSSPELMRQLYEMISEAKEIGRMAKDEKEFAKSFEREEEREQIIDKLAASKADKNKFITQLTNVYRRGVSNLYSMLNSIAGKDIADKYEMETVMNRAEMAENKHLKETNAKAEAIYGVKSYGDLLNVMADKGQAVGVLYRRQTDIEEGEQTERYNENFKYDVSILDIVDIYNAIKNKKTREDYEKAYGADQINRLMSLLSPEDRAFGDMLMEDVNSRFPELNKVYVATYGMDLKKVDNYWMGSAEHLEPVDIFNDFRQQSTTPGFFKERTAGTVTPVAKNAWIKYQKHISQSYYMTEVAAKYKQLSDVFNSKRIKNLIQNRYGEGVYNTLTKQIQNIGLNAQSPRLDDVSGLFQRLLNNWVGAKVALNPVVFVGQMTAFTNYAEGVKTSAFMKNFAYALRHPIEVKDFMMKHNGDFLRNRYESGFSEAMSAFINDAKETSGIRFGFSPKARFNLTNALSFLVRQGDLASLIYGGYGQFKTMLDSGMSVEEAKKKYEFYTLRSQQSGNAASISDWQQQRGFARLYLAFKNTSMQYTRKIADTIIMLNSGDISRTEGTKILTNYLLIQPSLWVIAKNIAKSLLGLADDDDEFDDGVLEQLLVNPIEGVPLIGDMVRWGYNEAAGEKNYSLFSTPLLDDVERSFRKASKEEKDVYDYADIIIPFIEMLTSVPVATAKRYIKKIDESDGE